MKLSSGQIIKLHELVEKGAGASVAYTGCGKQFFEEYSIGAIERKRVKFSYQDLSELNRLMDSLGIGDKVFATPFDNRMDASRYGDEKLAREAITSGFVMVMGVNAPMTVENGEIPAGCALTLPIDEANKIKAGTVVFVENLEVFLKLHSYPIFLDLFKDEIKPVVALYRGGQGFMSTKGAKTFLDEFKGEIVGFCDFDPAGINQIGYPSCHKLIFPSIECRPEVLKKISKEDAYLDQVSNKKGLLSIAKNSPGLAPYIDLMLSSELAVMSEHLLSHESALSIVSLE
jgi:hypothetical protein